MKKVYEVELKYEAYIVVSVEANSPEEAETLAYGYAGTEKGGQWSLESIEEMGVSYED